MVIGNLPTSYVDGGFGYNNPIRALMEEVADIWPSREIGSIISLGTGVPMDRDVGRTIQPLLETLKSMALDTEKTAREFNEDMRSRYQGKRIYFRFNPTGLGNVELEEWKELERVHVATRNYLNVQKGNVLLCASQLHCPIGV